MYKIFYEVEYLDGHKASLAVNTISENIFSQFDEEGNIFLLFGEIVDHRVDRTETTKKDALIFQILEVREGGRLPKYGKLRLSGNMAQQHGR